MAKKRYTISITLNSQEYDNPLEAAKGMLKDVIEDGNFLVWDVVDEDSNEKFTVDLSEEDEDAVLPVN